MEQWELYYMREVSLTSNVFDELNLTQLIVFRTFTCEYITAGAQIIETIPSVQTR